MKRRGKRLSVLLLAAVLLLPRQPVSARSAVVGEKTVAAVSPSGRAFCLVFRVWAEDWSGLEVVHALDGRFELTEFEQERLAESGAKVRETPDGWRVAWKPESASRGGCWETSLNIRARDSFPGGNDVETDREGAGLYRDGALLATLPVTMVNVALNIRLRDFETELFLGRRVRLTVDGENVERAMLSLPEAARLSADTSGELTCLWERETGEKLGEFPELEREIPKTDAAYRLRVTYRPASLGTLSAGEPLRFTEQTALYRVRVVPGTLRIRVKAPEGAIGPDDALRFCVRRSNGETRYCTAEAEADPEGGELFLAAEVTGLPYGAYTVTPLPGEGLACEERQVSCLLGLWEKDDTVSTGRASALAVFTLREQGEEHVSHLDSGLRSAGFGSRPFSGAAGEFPAVSREY